MRVAVFPSGPFLTNTLLVWDPETKDAVLVDPADPRGVDGARELAEKQELKVKFILNTHEHPDHTACNALAKLTFPDAEIAMHPLAEKYLSFWTESDLGTLAGAEYSPKPSILLKEGDLLELGSAVFEVLHTPGHSPGSIVLYSREESLAIVGDLIFKGGIGRYDLPMGDREILVESLKRVTAYLHPETVIYPGHGEKTTIGREISGNPYLEELLR